MGRAADTILIRGLVVVGLLVAVGALGAARRRRRAGYEPRLARLPDGLVGAGPLTAFYFTSRLCSECRETPGIVREAAPDLPIVPVWVHERPDLVRALGVFETPTLLLADGEGRIRYARVGNPTVAELRLYVDEALA